MHQVAFNLTSHILYPHPMPKTRFQIPLHHPFNLKLTAESHGWSQLAPFHWDGKTLARTSRIKNRKAWIQVQQSSKKKLTVETTSPDNNSVEQIVTRWLHLDWNPSDFLTLCDQHDPAIAKLVRAGGGRFLRGDTFYEDLIKTICTINVTWQQTKNMVASLVALSGESFPTPKKIQALGAETLAAECKMGFRAKTIDNVTTQLLEDKIIRIDGAARTAVDYDYLTSMKGIGPYAAAHTLVLSRDFATLPVDSEVSAYLRSQGLDPAKAQKLFEHWGEFRFLGYKLKRMADKTNWIGD
jgi:3-methyladenine DNA glycosylase/8-oxoguanine DNA glycosylase